MNMSDLETLVERLDRIARLLERSAAAMEQAASKPAGNAAQVALSTSEPLWDARQTAEFLHCSTSKIYKAAEANALPCLRDGRNLRFKPSDMRAHVERLRNRPGTVVAMR